LSALAARPTLEEQIDIRFLRQFLGLRLREVAHACECSMSYVHLIETHVLDRPEMVRKIRKYLVREAQRRMRRSA
jgi:predicted transcriptional regulator